MQEQEIQNLINERMSQLPEVIRNEITNGDWEETIRKIVEENDLLIDQGLAIEKSTIMMMLGIENSKNYTKNIKKRANLSSDKATNIAYEVDKKILQKIKSKVIEEAEKEEGMQDNTLKDILGPKQEIDEIIPDINLNTTVSDEDERSKLINELQDDIEIADQEDDDDYLEEINEQEKEWINQSKKTQVSNNITTNEPVKENQIPFKQENSPNPRIIDTNSSKQPDNLPGLEPLRTLQTDSEDRDDIVSSKLGGSNTKKSDDNNAQQKNSGPDPYREPVE